MSDILKQAEEKMQKAVLSLQEELKTIRTGRPNPEIFKKVRVECYGTSMSLLDVATVTVPDGQSFLVQPFDKGNLKAIESAISASELGLSTNNDGEVIRIVVPPLSKDRREELIKKVHKIAEEQGKVSIRHIRQEAKDKIKKLKDESVSEDEIKKQQDSLEKTTSKYTTQIDELSKQKEKELLVV